MLTMLASLAGYERELISLRINADIVALNRNGARFDRPAIRSQVLADKLVVASDAQAKERAAEEAAQLIG
ncbi:hypothetical protein ACX80I_15845 [Arthrobacter sp. MDT3-44]